MPFALGPLARAQGFTHRHAASLGSTNAEALAQGLDRLWVTADEQTAGRGRRGRSWASPAGNLYASLCLIDAAPMAHVAELCFLAALAVADAIEAVAPRAAARLALKWPNDVLIGGAKVAGILVEGTRISAGSGSAIGCGVNVASHPEGLAYAATHLAGHDPQADAAALFAALSDAMAARLQAWDRGANFPALRQDWLGRAAGLGKTITARLPHRDLVGTFEDLDASGALILREAGGKCQVISAGEIVFGHKTSHRVE